LLAVAVLGVILAASLFSPVAGRDGGGIDVVKVTTNGDTTTEFHFTIVIPDGTVDKFWLVSGGGWETGVDPNSGVYTALEEVPSGWELEVACDSLDQVSSFEYIPNGVRITFVAGDVVGCKFINSPAPSVGGVVMPANTLAILMPWLAVIGVVGCIGTAVVVAKKRSP